MLQSNLAACWVEGTSYKLELHIVSEKQTKCFNCLLLCDVPVYFPVQKNQYQIIFNNLPHCRKSCVLRTIANIPTEASDLTLLFHNVYENFYNDSVPIAAPPREYLFASNGMTLENYHKNTHFNNTFNLYENLLKKGYNLFIQPPCYSLCQRTLSGELSPQSVEIIDKTLLFYKENQEHEDN